MGSEMCIRDSKIRVPTRYNSERVQPRTRHRISLPRRPPFSFVRSIGSRAPRGLQGLLQAPVVPRERGPRFLRRGGRLFPSREELVPVPLALVDEPVVDLRRVQTRLLAERLLILVRGVGPLQPLAPPRLQRARRPRGKLPLLPPLQKLTLCLLYTSPSPRDGLLSRMPSSA